MTFRKMISKSPDINSLAKVNDVKCFVFSTSLQNKEDVEEVAGLLNSVPEILDWSVDLEDWEKVLRVECTDLAAEQITQILSKKGVSAIEMAT